jgi:Zn-dependent protease
MEETLIKILFAAFPVVMAITVHEWAHGRVALACGDSTAKALGRLSFNPIRHIDPVGTILVPLALLALSRSVDGAVPIFGWAKPVPVNIGALRNPLRDQFWVSGAGPAANLLMLVGWVVIFWLVKNSPLANFGLLSGILVNVAFFGIFANLGLMLINLIPILPLDGGRIVMSLLPRRQAYSFSQTERYGFFIILFLLMSGLLDKIFRPIFNSVANFIF